MLKSVLTTVLMFIGGVVGDQCPPESLTRPCHCDMAGGVSLICEGIQSEDVLDGVFRRTGSFKFGTFQLVNSRVAWIPSHDSLVPKQIRSLSVMQSNLTRLFDETPDESNLVLMLSLETVVFEEGVPWTQFRNLKTLRFLSFFEIDVPVLGSEFKTNVNSDLKLLMLQNSKTARIENGALSGFESLTDLRIEYAGLSELKRTWFPARSALVFLSFEGNQIRSVPEDMFSEMPSLQILSLKKNKLVTLSEQTFGHVFGQLTTLDLNGNPIECNCSIQWITSQDKRQLLGKCASPENVKGKLIADLQSTDLGACH